MSSTLFLGDLAAYCSNDSLWQMFSPFGRIVDIRIKHDSNTGKNLAYGFVEFEHIHSAINAMNSLNGHICCGRPLK